MTIPSTATPTATTEVCFFFVIVVFCFFNLSSFITYRVLIILRKKRISHIQCMRMHYQKNNTVSFMGCQNEESLQDLPNRNILSQIHSSFKLKAHV